MLIKWRINEDEKQPLGMGTWKSLIFVRVFETLVFSVKLIVLILKGLIFPSVVKYICKS